MKIAAYEGEQQRPWERLSVKYLIRLKPGRIYTGCLGIKKTTCDR